ncbi:uncharacterized protein LOC119688504 [Teleopsis dalmanni]|uniref:uncharacterized protein LOC119688504 n=1 Tax=Teleopsis dalmanni TaxID=139649 RepID=UPI0018CCA97B|nr:uncharacterized protein LOC119688504 [Teleopsis dalmanni]
MYGNLCSDVFKYKKNTAIQYNLEEARSTERLAHRLRLAVLEGGSIYPKQNAALKETIRTAIKKGMQVKKISKIIDDFYNPLDPFCTHIVQLRIGLKICAIITVDCSSLQKFKRILQPLLKRFRGAFSTVLPFFNCTNNVEALMSEKTALNFKDLANRLMQDGLTSKATAVEMLDYETGAVNFKCDPVQLKSTCQTLKKRGYHILHMNCNFIAKAPIRLTCQENGRYFKFLTKLLEIPHVIKIYDNVAFN